MILIVDFGSQLAHLISRRLKDIGVESQLTTAESLMENIREKHPKGVILSGGPASVYAPDALTIDPALFTLSLPVLGICYGWQLMAQLTGGHIESTAHEYGIEDLTVPKPVKLLDQFPKNIHVVMSHGDSVTGLPKQYQVLASTASVHYAAVAHKEKPWYGVQFHPEAEHTECGSLLLTNFSKVCQESFVPHVFSLDKLVQNVKDKVGEGNVICAVSGGVDSSVAAAIIAKAIGKKLTPVYVESGLMRPGTRQRVEEIFHSIVPANLLVVEAEERFLKALKGIIDPEKKRRIIGKLYIDLFGEVAAKMGGVTHLGQGTIYSDVIESKGSTHAHRIRVHHNVAGLPKDLKFQLVEPLRFLYKDEVRAVGRELNLPDEVVSQQPFPGPGYAIRIRGEVTPERLEQAKQADMIVIDEMMKSGLWEKVFQCFAIMTNTMSTGVKGDGRVLAEVVAVRAYESTEVMTSQVAELPYPVIKKIASRIVNEVPNVSRVVYDVTGKPPATMEWE